MAQQRKTSGVDPTYENAIAAGRDAGNRSAQSAGRTVWNEDDYDAACAVTDKILELNRSAA